jgi:hypothetical protein
MRTLVSAAKQQTAGGRSHKPLVPSMRSAVGLQRTLGNEAVQRLMESGAGAPGADAVPPTPGVLQAKLAVGPVNDPLEREADRVADQVMRMPDPLPVSCRAPPQISRKCAACEQEEEGKLQKKSAAEAAPQTAPATVHEVLASPGVPLDPSTRAFMESRFGHDFSRVRVHADVRSAESARSIDSLAYTVSNNVVFAAGQYAPETSAGRRLIAHELAHVVQQSGTSEAAVVQRTCGQNNQESFYARAPNYCKDTGFSGILHPGKTCYREIPPNPAACSAGDQVCFDKSGNCSDSFDNVSAAGGKDASGGCVVNWKCFPGHASQDIIPGLPELSHDLGLISQDTLDCMEGCDSEPWYTRPFCRAGCVD